MKHAIDAVRDADVVVIGAGAAGASVALGLAPRRVDLLAKGPLGRTGASPWAQGGIAAAVGDDDAPARHAADTLAVAGELGDPDAVACLTAEGPARIAALLALGVRFDRSPDGRLDLAREAAHSRSRVLHAGDATGAELSRALAAAVADREGIAVFPGSFAVALAQEGARVGGVLVRHADGALVLHRARAVVLATGGAGRVFSRTTNPPEATGDGLALAWRAGAELADLEFFQFHPTALDAGADPLPLLTEALRGAGARLVDVSGAPLLAQLGPAAELLPRDVVARALAGALAAGRRPLLDARALPDLAGRFPTVVAACREHGLDPSVDLLPVAPAAHYHMGGVRTDLSGRTSLARLWACGEVAATGVHGANRLASNSLLEALVFGARTARSVADALRALPRPAPASALVAALPAAAWPPFPAAELTAPVQSTLRALMWRSVGLVREERGLCAALARLETLAAELPPGPCETANLLTLARLVTRAALERRESRGAHFRQDFPASSSLGRHRLVLSQVAGALRLEREALAAAALERREVTA